MSEGIALREKKGKAAPKCRHHWVIDTPHGATSRGVCKRCGARKRFPNSADDALREGDSSPRTGRWGRVSSEEGRGFIHEVASSAYATRVGNVPLDDEF